MKAAARVNRPRAIRAPVTSSMTPPAPDNDNSSTRPIPSTSGKPNSFTVPWARKSRPAMMRKAASAWGEKRVSWVVSVMMSQLLLDQAGSVCRRLAPGHLRQGHEHGARARQLLGADGPHRIDLFARLDQHRAGEALEPPVADPLHRLRGAEQPARIGRREIERAAHRDRSEAVVAQQARELVGTEGMARAERR